MADIFAEYDARDAHVAGLQRRASVQHYALLKETTNRVPLVSPSSHGSDFSDAYIGVQGPHSPTCFNATIVAESRTSCG